MHRDGLLQRGPSLRTVRLMDLWPLWIVVHRRNRSCFVSRFRSRGIAEPRKWAEAERTARFQISLVKRFSKVSPHTEATPDIRIRRPDLAEHRQTLRLRIGGRTTRRSAISVICK